MSLVLKPIFRYVLCKYFLLSVAFLFRVYFKCHIQFEQLLLCFFYGFAFVFVPTKSLPNLNHQNFLLSYILDILQGFVFHVSPGGLVIGATNTVPSISNQEKGINYCKFIHTLKYLSASGMELVMTHELNRWVKTFTLSAEAVQTE